MNINKILLELAADNSRLAKESILRKNKDNMLLMQVFHLALDPYLNFYIKKIPAYTPVEGQSEIFLEFAIDALSDLSSRAVTGNAAIAHLVGILNSLNFDDSEVIVKIIRRDLRCGVSTATVNKIWKNLIPKYACLLCTPYDSKVIKKIKWPAFVQKKEDGCRVNAIVHNGVCEYFSRKGSPIELKDDSLANEFIRLANGQSLVFDGELLAYKNGKPLPRKEGNGIATKAIKGTITEEESALLHAILWDVIPFEDFKACKCDIQYQHRFVLLQSLIVSIYGGVAYNVPQKIQLVPTEEVDSFEQAEIIFNRYLSDGMEGVIIKNKTSLWSDTRSDEQIKLKAEKTCELRVIGWNYGEVGTKNEFRLGSLLCQSEDGKVLVNISGFTDEDRNTITKENSINRIVTVTYNERITKKNGGVDSLFLPRILEFRDDKDVADTSDLIK